MTIRSHAIIVLSSLILTACQHGVMYLGFRSVPLTGWSSDSTLQYRIPITDTINRYDVLLHLRHTDAYPYQNMWLFVNDDLSADTIEFFLADDRGKWLGNGHSMMEMPVLYREHIQFTDSIYTISIQHGMREVLLKGVSDIGVEIVRK